ncbi:hypothetical protein CAEBREN_31527 [Caenorhabditis brenneri]|uniref:Uncharacterized protein n=1 Tax=Caenorhabditis brenneri TaxID=135651 RepID=G0NVT7_CAEBE|nr:hypothetical protein CAEBREN_31527 [Caenorhabditis brenneri]
MAPKTRSSSRKLIGVTDNATTTQRQKNSKSDAPNPEKSFDCVNIEGNVNEEEESIETMSIEKQKQTELDTSDEETESDSESVSSSSAEDSDDDYELELNKIGILKKSCKHGSSGEEDIVRDIEKKIERETKKKRIRQKENRFLKGQVSDSEDVICEFEPTDLAKLRRRRLYRRKMILTTDVDWDDPEIDMRAAKRLFRELESEDECSDQSEEDEADIIGHNLPVYMSRNSTERVSQIIELKVAPFSEKLACFKKTLHTSSQLDAHEKCNNFLNDIATEQKMETEYKLLREIQQKINEKSTESNVNSFEDNHDNFNDSDHLQLMEDDFGDFSMDNDFYEPDIRDEEDYTFY